MNTTIKHEVDGRTYEIRTMQTDNGWDVGIFWDGKRISPRYSVSFETSQYLHNYHGEHAVAQLIQIAQSDLDAGNVK